MFDFFELFLWFFIQNVIPKQSTNNSKNSKTHTTHTPGKVFRESPHPGQPSGSRPCHQPAQQAQAAWEGFPGGSAPSPAQWEPVMQPASPASPGSPVGASQTHPAAAHAASMSSKPLAATFGMVATSGMVGTSGTVAISAMGARTCN